MNVRLSLLACLGLFLASLHADEAADRVEIVRRAREMIDATFKGEMLGVLKFMHPSVIRISGGEEAVKKTIGEVAAQMKGVGLEFVSMDVRPPEKLFVAGEKTFAVVKTKTVMKIPGKTEVTETGSMLAVRSTPDGAWTFIRVNAQVAENRALLKSLLPEIPDDLVIVAPGKPVAVPISK